MAASSAEETSIFSGDGQSGSRLVDTGKFIGGKIEPGETPCEALARECREEIALEIVNARVRTAVTHAYPDRTIHLTLIDCEPAPGAEPVALEHDALGWYTSGEMQSLNFCPADAELLPVVFEDYSSQSSKCS